MQDCYWMPKKKRVTIQYETLVRPSDIKGKEEKE
jgi:hypothetical protein